ncbi:hypothetical protein ABV409_14435 [Flagellimonas sp. DF-77]|uniref:hypothetical protein n=1 Tax=Flagellimonas algarum TaxID=3230298 RepID=UPI003390B9FA
MADGSLSQFKATLARKQARKEKAKGKFKRNRLHYTSKDTEREFDFPKLTATELEEVKNKIRSKAKAQRRKERVVLGLLLIGLLWLLYYINR